MFECWPGAGKTYCCINSIIPSIENHTIEEVDLDIGEIKKTKKKNKYIVISTKHSALSAYYNKGLNAKVIQKFTFNRACAQQLKDYDFIIVDEAALLEPHHYECLYKNIGKQTKLIFLGDPKQLLPYGSKRGSDHPWMSQEILKKFNYSIEMETNYRNDYTTDQYIQMMKLEYKLTNFEKRVINRQSDLNICVTNKHKDELNEMIIEEKRWTDSFGHLKVKRGGRLIATIDNPLNYPIFSKANIYNSSFYDIKDYNDKTITLINCDNKKETTISKELFKNNFDYGYTITAFRSQGLSIPYNKIGIFDMDFLKQDGRLFYTVFSRIQTKNF